ncbi:MAG: winged helix-turn-helix domain-containing protein [Oscillospiraceae bacterium]|nr:winged helix-turn-helix domain-containing protein [Oscillospiraceae bacterium]
MNAETLHVQMFGTFSLSYAGRTISCSESRSKLLWNMLAYLVCHRGEFVSAEELSAVIWKSEKNGNPSSAMRTAIHRARQMLSELVDDPSVQLLISKNGGYLWNPEVETVVDTDEFDRLAVSLSGSSDDLEAGLAALELYEGKFLPMQSSELWVMPVQAYYQNVFTAIVDRVIPLLEEQKRYEEDITICRKALEFDPYNETFYQHLMRALLAEGRRQEVMQVYEEMSKLLLTAFGVMPDQESRALYREALQTDTRGSVISPEDAIARLSEQDEIRSALICDYDFFRMVYQAQARVVVRSGQVIHIALLTLKPLSRRDVSERSLSLAMDNLEQHLGRSLRKGDVITRCSASQFLVMLPSANYENSCKVCRRFISAFEKKYPHAPVYVDFFVQPLMPSTRS